MNSNHLSTLRQKLRSKLLELDKLLLPAFDREPVFPGTLLTSSHRCGKLQCHCTTHGDLHESLRLQVRFKDGMATRCVSEEQAELWRPRTEAYKRIRDAQRALRKWQKEVLELLDAIERARRSTEGLSYEDRRRPLR